MINSHQPRVSTYRQTRHVARSSRLKRLPVSWTAHSHMNDELATPASNFHPPHGPYKTVTSQFSRILTVVADTIVKHDS